MQTHLQDTDLSFEMNSNWLLLQRCTRSRVEKTDERTYYWEGNVVVPESSGDNSNQAIVLNAGPDCKELRRDVIEKAVEDGRPLRLFVKENCAGLHRVYGEIWAIREDNQAIIPCLIQE